MPCAPSTRIWLHGIEGIKNSSLASHLGIAVTSWLVEAVRLLRRQRPLEQRAWVLGFSTEQYNWTEQLLLFFYIFSWIFKWHVLDVFTFCVDLVCSTNEWSHLKRSENWKERKEKVSFEFAKKKADYGCTSKKSMQVITSTVRWKCIFPLLLSLMFDVTLKYFRSSNMYFFSKII